MVQDPKPLPPKVGPDMDLERFIRIQDQPTAYGTEFERAIHEIREGRRINNWIWFIFPQLFSLDKQLNGRLYGIKSVDEAMAYLAHPILGPRLRRAAEAVLDSGEQNLSRLFGGEPGAVHFHASMTLFTWVCLGTDDEFFRRIMKKIWNGTWEERTFRILKNWEDETLKY